MLTRSFIRFALNGLIHEVQGADVYRMLGEYLRSQLLLTGTKIVCAEGDCGACTVLRAHSSSSKVRNTRFEPINSCMTTLLQLDGSQLLTIEALAKDQVLSPIQKSMVDHHGSQCGYCTPGFVMALTGLFDQNPSQPTEQSIKNHLTGNLCRCTGYTPIIEAAKSVDAAAIEPLRKRFMSAQITKALKETQLIPIEIKTAQGTLSAPLTMNAISALLNKQPKAKLLASGTDLAVQVNKGKINLGDLISLHLVPELYASSHKSFIYHFGAKVNLEEVRRLCAQAIPEFSALLNVFASPQIKNSATLVGNIANASPIGDTLPFLLVADGKVTVSRKARARVVPLTELFTAYRQLALAPGEWISSVSFRAPLKTEVLRLYKASTRKDLDISTVSIAFLFDLKKSAKGFPPKILSARIAVGGIAAIPLRLTRVEDFLQNKNLDQAIASEAQRIIQDEVHPLSDHRGSVAYRRLLLRNFFQQFCDEILPQAEVSHAASHS